MQPYSAIVLGSTGNVGRQIVNLLAASPTMVHVVLVNRRKSDEFEGIPNVRQIVVSDMDKLAEAVETAVRETDATVGLCAIGVGIPALGIYKPSVIFGNSNTPSYLHHLYPVVQWALPSRYHAIHKNELARAMVKGTRQALAELQEKRAEGGTLLTPVVRSYEYADMKPFFA